MTLLASAGGIAHRPESPLEKNKMETVTTPEQVRTVDQPKACPACGSSCIVAISNQFDQIIFPIIGAKGGTR